MYMHLREGGGDYGLVSQIRPSSEMRHKLMIFHLVIPSAIIQ